MKIILDRAETEVEENTTVADLVPQTGVKNLVWVNGKKIRQQDFQTTVLQEGDQVKIVKGVRYGG